MTTGTRGSACMRATPMLPEGIGHKRMSTQFASAVVQAVVAPSPTAADHRLRASGPPQGFVLRFRRPSLLRDGRPRPSLLSRRDVSAVHAPLLPQRRQRSGRACQSSRSDPKRQALRACAPVRRAPAIAGGHSGTGGSLRGRRWRILVPCGSGRGARGAAFQGAVCLADHAPTLAKHGDLGRAQPCVAAAPLSARLPEPFCLGAHRHLAARIGRWPHTHTHTHTHTRARARARAPSSSPSAVPLRRRRRRFLPLDRARHRPAAGASLGAPGRPASGRPGPFQRRHALAPAAFPSFFLAFRRRRSGPLHAGATTADGGARARLRKTHGNRRGDVDFFSRRCGVLGGGHASVRWHAATYTASARAAPDT